MKKYRLEMIVEANTPQEAAQKLFDEMYDRDDHMYIDAEVLEEIN